VQLCRAFVNLNKVDPDFFNEVAEFVIHCLSRPPEIADRFLGDPSFTLPKIGALFARAQVFHQDFFEMLKLTAFRRKDDMRDGSLKDLLQSVQEQRRFEEKKERKRSAPPERKRGAMGRAVIRLSAPEKKQTRREKAREHRRRLAAMSDEEVAVELAALDDRSGLSAAAKLLLSSLKMDAPLEAQEGSKEAKKVAREVLEASLCVSQRSLPKGKKEDVSASAKALIRAGKE